MTHSTFWPRSMIGLATVLSALSLAACKDSNSASSEQAAIHPNTVAQSIESDAKVLSTAVQEDPVIAALGDAQVRRSELNAILASLSPEQLEQLKVNRSGIEQWLRERLAEKALYQQALAQSWDKQDRIQQSLELAKQQLVVRSYLASVSQAPDSYPNEADIKQAYERNQAALQVPAQYRVEQLFFPITGQAELDAGMKRLLDEAGQQAKQSKNGLSLLGKELEQRSQGMVTRSETPLVPVTQLLPEVQAALGSLKKGQVSEALRSQTGWHILHVLEVQAARPATYDEVQPELRRLLREQRQQEIALSYLHGMLDTGTVSINGAELRQALDTPVQAAGILSSASVQP